MSSIQCKYIYNITTHRCEISNTFMHVCMYVPCTLHESIHGCVSTFESINENRSQSCLYKCVGTVTVSSKCGKAHYQEQYQVTIVLVDLMDMNNVSENMNINRLGGLYLIGCN